MKVLLVEDSRAVTAFVEGVLRAEPDMELLPVASDGRAGVEAARRLRPNLVLMDLELPGLDGVEAITEIMATAPCPIVVLSGNLELPGRNRTFESLRAGAVDVLAKPTGTQPDVVSAFRERLVRTVRVMSEARVVGRRCRPAAPLCVAPTPPSRELPSGRCELVAVGGSTGAPPLVYELLRALPGPTPFPIVVAQHIVSGFEAGFARWLCATGQRVKLAEDGEPLEAGTVYVARADGNLAVRPTRLEVRPGVRAPLPSVDVLFESVAESFGARAAGLLLSGMGDDGARGLLALRRAGALTATQSGESCVVASMPSAGRALGGSRLTLGPGELAALLKDLALLKTAGWPEPSLPP